MYNDDFYCKYFVFFNVLKYFLICHAEDRLLIVILKGELCVFLLLLKWDLSRYVENPCQWN